MKIKFFICFFLLVGTLSCTSMKKYLIAEEQLTQLRADSVTKEQTISTLNARVDELVKRTIALGRDTLRLFSENTALKTLNSELDERSRLDISKMSAQLQSSSARRFGSNNTQDNQKLKHIDKVSGALMTSMGSIKKELLVTLSRHDAASYSINTDKWGVVLRLSDDLLFDHSIVGGVKVYDRSKLSLSGTMIVSRLAYLIVEKDKIHVSVKEYVPLRQAKVGSMPTSHIGDMKTVDYEAVEKVIDSLLTDGVLSFSTLDKPQEMFYLPMEAADSSRVGELIAQMRENTSQYLIDSTQYSQSMSDAKTKYIRYMSNLNEQKQIGAAADKDRTTRVMELLLERCYNKLGANEVTKNAVYLRTVDKAYQGVEIVISPKLDILFEAVNE